MIFSDKKIIESIAARQIVIEPFNPACLGTNSYDVHLSRFLAKYEDAVLDAKNTTKFNILKYQRRVLYWSLVICIWAQRLNIPKRIIQCLFWRANPA